MGLKHEAKAIVSAAGVPVVPGYMGEDQSNARLAQEAARIGFPLLVKAVAGGGGKGMRVVRTPEELAEAAAGARGEAENAFGDGRLMLERFLERPRHIEVQVFGDSHGGCVHLFERECSVQRRYQKIIEESPSPFISPATRAAMTAAAVSAARAVDYVNAGTIEFIVDAEGHFYFMEMNTRLQVEHPVTEAVTGLDLVEWQLRVASGERLPLSQQEIQSRGHAIEARLYSEDPRRGFLPSVGRVERFVRPAGNENWRVDAGIEDGDAITVHYDPMIAKVIASGARSRECARDAQAPARPDGDLRRGEQPAAAARNLRPSAVRRGRRRHRVRRPGARGPDAGNGAGTRVAAAGGVDRTRRPHGLRPARIALVPRRRLARRWRGPAVHRPAHAVVPAIARKPSRRAGIEIDMGAATLAGSVLPPGMVAISWMRAKGPRTLELIRQRERLQIIGDQADEIALAPAWPYERGVEDADAHPASPLPGRVVELRVKAGDTVARGDVLAIVEGMKMQHAIRAGRAGRVAAVLARAGELVDAEKVLFDIEPT